MHYRIGMLGAWSTVYADQARFAGNAVPYPITDYYFMADCQKAAHF